ncbi:MAG: tetratricopeptide repeat protein [Synechococcaceae cyanobacterium SM2_3_1]|nr:tetratricopeptide repeat protein [Synechococcaceae cyanobacterium SM2_3_1]
MYARARKLHEAGRLKEALPLYRTLVKLQPDSSLYFNSLGNALQDLNQLEEAATAYTQAIHLDPSNASGHNNLGNTLKRNGRYAEAIQHYETALSLQPHYPQALNNLACTLKDLGQLSAALDTLRKAIELDPNYFNAHLNLARFLKDTQEWQAALTEYRRALELRPGHYLVHKELGDLYMDMEQWEEAHAVYRQAALLSPEKPEIHNRVGHVLEAMGQTKEAAASFLLTTQLDPENALAYVNLGRTLLVQQKLNAAIEAYETALKYDPGNQKIQLQLRRARSRQIKSWHFPMLADQARNEGYRQAIEKAVNPESHVLDIGTGTGLLSLMAARAGAKKVTGIEMLKPLAQIATEIVERNGYADRIQVIAKKSTQLVIGKDLARQADLIVSEIMDNGVLGEGVLPTIRHALEHLATPQARVIPKAVTLIGQLVQFPALRPAYPVKEICGFDLSPINRFRDPTRLHTIDLKAEDYRPLCDPCEIYHLDFLSLPPRPHPDHPHRHQIQIQGTTTGEIHALVVWFHLHLDDEITLSTGPGGELRHWRQVSRFFEQEKLIIAPDQPVWLHVEQMIDGLTTISCHCSQTLHLGVRQI